ncbi:MAG: hypothetical protein IKC49_01060 [Clostridia bacterium]|nr:hypothetical protein [Clostridia bacterium]
MFDLIKAFKRIPEEKKIVFFGKVNIIKNLLYFLFKIIVGIIFKSGLLIAIAIYNVLIGVVKANCTHGLKKNQDSIHDCNRYIQGGSIIAISSIFYILYAILQVVYPTNTKYTLVIAIIIALFSTINIVTSIVGAVRAKGKTLLVKEYKLSSLATAFNGLVLTQIAILSVMVTNDMSQYNSIFSIIIGAFILILGLYLIIDGHAKKKVIKQQA